MIAVFLSQKIDPNDGSRILFGVFEHKYDWKTKHWSDKLNDEYDYHEHYIEINSIYNEYIVM